MKTPGLIAVILTALSVTALSYADPPEHKIKIRKEYRGSEAPDHLMFAAHVNSMKQTAEFNRDIALDIVQQHMHFETEDAADAFLSRMIAVVDELESEQDKVFNDTLCRPDVPRSKEALYRLLDQVDDLAEVKTHNVYVKFLSTLDASQQDALTAWLQDAKEGLYYRAADHKSLYEASGGDVVERVQVICVTRVEQ